MELKVSVVILGQSGFIKTPNDDSHVGTENHHSQIVEAQGVRCKCKTRFGCFAEIWVVPVS